MCTLNLNALKEQIQLVEKGARVRKISIAYICNAWQELLNQTKYDEVRITSGMVSRSYKSAGMATYVWMHRDGRFIVAREYAKSCPHGCGHSHTFKHNKKFIEEVIPK